MVGLSHVALRRLIHDYMPEGVSTFWPTEMLNSRRIPYQDLEVSPYTLKHQKDENLIPQLLANEKKFIEPSIAKLKDWGAVGIDINMGCPVKRALQHNYGVSLMGDISYASNVVRWASEASSLPVSVKVRAGMNNEKSFLKDFLQSLEHAGAKSISIHPRLANEKRKGKADWALIAEAKNYISIPLIGNGDIQSVEDIDELFRVGNCDGVMIGRALNAKPWLLRQWLASKDSKYQTDIDYSDPRIAAGEYAKAMLQLLEYLILYFGEDKALKMFSFHIRVSHMWLSYGHKLIGIVNKKNSIQKVREDWQEFFSKDIQMYSHTNLRY